jgi:hypothetical protein
MIHLLISRLAIEMDSNFTAKLPPKPQQVSTSSISGVQSLNKGQQLSGFSFILHSLKLLES